VDFLNAWVPAGKSPIVRQLHLQDRRFLHRLMPGLERYFHYRNLDVSTIKELARRWAPEVYKGFSKESNHTGCRTFVIDRRVALLSVGLWPVGWQGLSA